MSAVHPIIWRRCPACGTSGTSVEFSGAYCRKCRALYVRAHSAARSAQRPIEEWRPLRLSVPPPSPAPTLTLVQSNTLEELRPLFVRLFEHTLKIADFRSLHTLIEESRTKVSKRNRDRIAREGWIV